MFPQDVPLHYSGPSIPEVELADIETHPIVRPKPAEEAKIAELAEESATALGGIFLDDTGQRRECASGVARTGVG
jgi:hypothetical protein